MDFANFSERAGVPSVVVCRTYYAAGWPAEGREEKEKKKKASDGDGGTKLIGVVKSSINDRGGTGGSGDDGDASGRGHRDGGVLNHSRDESSACVVVPVRAAGLILCFFFGTKNTGEYVSRPTSKRP